MGLARGNGIGPAETPFHAFPGTEYMFKSDVKMKKNKKRVVNVGNGRTGCARREERIDMVVRFSSAIQTEKKIGMGNRKRKHKSNETTAETARESLGKK